jgi:hypothetical protein
MLNLLICCFSIGQRTHRPKSQGQSRSHVCECDILETTVLINACLRRTFGKAEDQVFRSVTATPSARIIDHAPFRMRNSDISVNVGVALSAANLPMFR